VVNDPRNPTEAKRDKFGDAAEFVKRINKKPRSSDPDMFITRVAKNRK
jgi:hypothetical protein